MLVIVLVRRSYNTLEQESKRSLYAISCPAEKGLNCTWVTVFVIVKQPLSNNIMMTPVESVRSTQLTKGLPQLIHLLSIVVPVDMCVVACDRVLTSVTGLFLSHHIFCCKGTKTFA